MGVFPAEGTACAKGGGRGGSAGFENLEVGQYG